MKIKLEAIYHAEDDGEPYTRMNLLSRNKRSLPFRLWLLPRHWRRLELTLIVELKKAKFDITSRRGEWP